MSWEAVTGISTAVTALVIALSAIFALRQLQELQRAESFNGTDRLLEKWESAELRDARRYVLKELPNRLRDPAYREGLLREGAAAELADYPELIVLRFLERIGTYLFYGLLIGAAIHENIIVYMMHAWPSLRQVAEIMRTAEDNPYMFDKAEMLYEESIKQVARTESKLQRLRPSTGRRFRAEELVEFYSSRADDC